MGNKYCFTFIDLFSGIGGFHLGLERVGGKCLMASDIYEKANQSYYENFDIIPKGDIKELTLREIPDHNLLCAGFPCQPFSNIGPKGGLGDPRGELIYEIARILKGKQPKAFILENVKGLMRIQQGKAFQIILNILEKSGYHVKTQILEAKDYGVPQIRKRLFFVGVRNDINIEFTFPDPTPLLYTLSDVFDGRKVEREFGYTIRIGGRRSGINNRFNWDAYYVDGEVTIITPEQCLRLQGFPENFKLLGNQSDKYKQVGNSVPTTVVTAIGNQLIKLKII